MPNFMEVRDWIKEQAEDMGARISNRKAKHYAGEWLLLQDPQLSYNSLTYSDETGEKACKRWFAKEVAA